MTPSPLGLTRSAFAAAALVASAVSQADVIAYDSTRPAAEGWLLINDSGSKFEPNSRIESAADGFENDAQAADIVSLAGTGRFVTQFQARFYRFFASPGSEMSVTATLTLYSLASGLPDQEIWSGQLTGAFSSASGTDRQVLDLLYTPGVTVPDTFAFAIAIDDCTNSGQSMGPRWTATAPSIGTSPDYVLLQNSTTLDWYQEVASVHHLEAKIWTVPGPAGLLCTLAAGLPILRRRR